MLWGREGSCRSSHRGLSPNRVPRSPGQPRPRGLAAAGAARPALVCAKSRAGSSPSSRGQEQAAAPRARHSPAPIEPLPHRVPARPARLRSPGALLAGRGLSPQPPPLHASFLVTSVLAPPRHRQRARTSPGAVGAGRGPASPQRRGAGRSARRGDRAPLDAVTAPPSGPPGKGSAGENRVSSASPPPRAAPCPARQAAGRAAAGDSDPSLARLRWRGLRSSWTACRGQR